MQFLSEMVEFHSKTVTSGDKLSIMDRIEQMHDDIIERVRVKNIDHWTMGYRIYDGFESLSCDILLLHAERTTVELINYVSISGNKYTSSIHAIDQHPLAKMMIKTAIPQFHKMDKLRWNKVLEVFPPTPIQINVAFGKAVNKKQRLFSSTMALVRADDNAGYEYHIHEFDDGYIFALMIDGYQKATYALFEDMPMFFGDDPTDMISSRLISFVTMFEDSQFLNAISEVTVENELKPEDMIGKFASNHLEIYPERIYIFPELKKYCGKVSNAKR